MDWLTGNRSGEAKKLVSQLGDPLKRERAASQLVQIGLDSIPALIDGLSIEDQLHLEAIKKVLVRIGPAAVPALASAVTTVHPLPRGQVAEILGAIKDQRAVPALLQALGGEFFTVRARAALALGQLRDNRAIPALSRGLKDQEPEVRAAAARGLAAFAEPRTFEALSEVLLDDPRLEVRQAAAEALGETRRAEAIPYLMAALHDSFWWYEREKELNSLLEAIVKMGPAVVPELIGTLKDPEGTVRKLAAVLLGRIPDPRAIEPLTLALYDTHFDVCRASAEALAAMGEPALPVLLEALKHPEAWIRQQAVLGLTAIHDPQVAPAIMGLIGDENREVRKQVILSLGQIKDPCALPALRDLAASRSDRELASLARQAIQNFG